jgi:hypothetical protein
MRVPEVALVTEQGGGRGDDKKMTYAEVELTRIANDSSRRQTLRQLTLGPRILIVIAGKVILYYSYKFQSFPFINLLVQVSQPETILFSATGPDEMSAAMTAPA